MRLKKLLLVSMLATAFTGFCNPVIIKMNAVSTTMTLADKETGKAIPVPEPENKEYSLDLQPGKYLLSGYGTDKTTFNGKIEINVTDSITTQQFTVITCTAYVSNKTDGESWTIEKGDFDLDVKVNTREGVRIEQVPGNSITTGRYTFLALNGNSYNVAFVPSEKHREEGYMTLYRGGTLTANVNVTGAIPVGGDFQITIPEDAQLQVGLKFTHFTDFTPVQPNSIEHSEGGKTYKYTLANGQVYNYRAWKKGGLTHGGYFTMNTADNSKCPVINFTEEDFAKYDPKAINHSVQSNKGYETGDLLLNINPAHHLKLKPGEDFLVHGMRMWELSDNSTNNYFFEPDFHYQVLDTNFNPSTDVIEIENADTDVSAWSKIKAKNNGTAIVLVTYDGINLNYYNNAEKKEYLGGEYWGAIWPENTGVFVVTVGEQESSVVPNMTINEEYNMDALRLAGNNVDAEHDVFYYLESEEGFNFTFKPENIDKIEIATASISETEATYKGFSQDGIIRNEDGSYTILLKEGRNIVRMTDVAGNSVYQVLRAKPCKRVITNETRPGSNFFQPGDKVKIQYSGLFHPANKIAGIYNMSAYVTYNGVPNGSSLILGAGQYTFGSAASAQAVIVDIPVDYDAVENPVWVMDKGVLQVNGYGDPIGNHRNTSPTAGRSPNFTAVPHKTYFGAIPDIRLNVEPIKYFNITISGAPEEAKINLSFEGEEIAPSEDGIYNGTYGSYSLVVTADGYKCFRSVYNIDDESTENIEFPVEMQLLGDAWDGKTMTEPFTDENGYYLIATGAELAWFADNVNTKGGTQNAKLIKDIELGNFEWTPIGSSSKNYSGSFSGQGFSISEIFVEENTNYKGLFGYVKAGNIAGLTLSGSVTGKQYVGALAGLVAGESTVDRCANYCEIKGTGTYVGGIVGYLNSANASLTNCYNAGNVTGTTNCGGVIGNNNANAVMTNIFNVGAVQGTGVGACVGGSTAKNNLSNAFAVNEYQITTNQTLVTWQEMASGEIAYKLGNAFSQTIGEDLYPVFNGLRVYYDESSDEYFNYASGINIDPGMGNLDVEVSDHEISMCQGSTYVISVKAEPQQARLQEIKWSVDNEDVLKVENIDERSVAITGLSEGISTLRAETENDSEIYDVCMVKVHSATMSVEEIRESSIPVIFDIFDIAGRVVKINGNLQYLEGLNPGLYIIKEGNKVKHVMIK